ncbi:MAG: sensor histidine kinase [Flavobacteriaceae bacterium]|nr:sensor histidine kinase [Bacteroidia bacterium]NNF73998.1 sensor histidine kinase [Flavobacteriaceae bacterium]NNK72864.1 sensor histidine kinase [Flavobacteriaceae bacterium]
MSQSFKKSYKFAFKSALMVSLSLTLLTSVFLHFFFAFKLVLIILFFILCLIISFLVIQFRVEYFIYRRVKKIYDDLTLLESSSFRKEQITTDMATLTKEIDKYAKDKKLEIETLKIRETYRKEFLGNVSHELKTPLFTVQSYISTLLEGAVDDKKLQNKYLKRADKGLERLIFIVKELDMISKLETGDLSLEIETFDIVEVVQNVFDMFEMNAAKKKISLVFDMDYNEPVKVIGDKERIQQVLSNLIVNSIKYGRSKGTTEVSIENLIKNKVIVRVTDNGEGIEEENIPRLFERFYRVDKTGSRKEGGSGLGLAIVKHIIEAHDEKIYVESEHGVGSEFSFTLEKAK